MVSVLILTLNEQVNLPGCLESVSWSDDIVVFDSFSTDRTVEIAEARGARVFQRQFDGYAAQRSTALTEVQYNHPWILMIDADERITQDAKSEIEHAITCDNGVTLYRMRRKDMLRDRWLKRSSGYPTWFARLFRVGRVRIERDINEEYYTDGKVGYLENHLIHYPFDKGVAFWLERHNRYSTMEAEVLIKEIRSGLDLPRFFSPDPVVRRRVLKQLAYRLPFRPLLVFCYLYFFRLGFLDGIPGLAYCRLRSMYEYMIDLKVKELRRREKGLPI